MTRYGDDLGLSAAGFVVAVVRADLPDPNRRQRAREPAVV